MNSRRLLYGTTTTFGTTVVRGMVLLACRKCPCLLARVHTVCSAIQPRKPVLDRAERMAPTRQQMSYLDYVDTGQESVCPERLEIMKSAGVR